MKTKKIYKSRRLRYNSASKTRKLFLYDPKNPTKTQDIYSDANPKDTIPIKYTTTQDVINTIHNLEKLYKSKKYTHKRIWQVGMIMKVRLEILKNKKPSQYTIAKRYYEFLKMRTKLKEPDRYNLSFKL